MTTDFLALGDSYTIGEGVEEADRWPVLLQDSLVRHGLELGQPQIIARTGWTTGELLAAIREAGPEGPYALVSLLIGVNNQYRGPLRGFTTEGYTREFNELLGIAIGLAGGDPQRVLVVSIPDYSVTPFVPADQKQRVAREIDDYNRINRELSQQAGARYADITPLSRQAATDPSLLAADQLHPSGRMYRQWLQLLVPEARRALDTEEAR
jgi:lysophospholipase L1-like esterase